MAAPHIASHWIKSHGATGDVIAQKAMDGNEVVLDTTIDNDFERSKLAAEANYDDYTM